MLWQARSHTNKCLNLLAWKCQFTTVVLSGGNGGQPILWMCVGQLDVWWIGLIDIRDMYGSIISLEDKGCCCMSMYSLVRALTSVFYYNIFYRMQTKLRECNVFTPVCRSFCSQREGFSVFGSRRCTPPGHTPRTHTPLDTPPHFGQQVGDTHPTGMLSCST